MTRGVVADWWFLVPGRSAAGAIALIGRHVGGRTQQSAAANAAELEPIGDLSHLPVALQHTALWCLADGGFESRVIHSVVSRGSNDVEVTAFDLETLRERRGEWAWLPVEPPFRIAGAITVVVCQVPRALPHLLFKHMGRSDKLEDDDALGRVFNIAKNGAATEKLGMPRSYPAEMPELPVKPLDVGLPPAWRGYGSAVALAATLAGGELGGVMARTTRRDLVVELLGELVVVYFAGREGCRG